METQIYTEGRQPCEGGGRNWELCCRKPGSTKDCWQVPAAGMGMQGPSPGDFWGSMALLTPPFQISVLQNCEELVFWANRPFVAPGKQHRTSHPGLQVTPPARFGPYLWKDVPSPLIIWHLYISQDPTDTWLQTVSPRFSCAPCRLIFWLFPPQQEARCP